MNANDRNETTKPAVSETSAEEGVQGESKELSEKDLEAVSGGTAEKTREGVKKTMQTQ